MIKYFDIFAGIGGFRSGLEKAGGFECVGYCEIDRYAKKAYETMYDTEGEVWFCQYHLTHFIRTRIMQRERYDHSRAFFGLPEAAHRWRCRFFC